MRKPIPWCDLAVFLNVGCSHIVRNGQTCLYVVAPCTWTQKSSLKKLTSTHAIRLVTRASKVANRTLLSAILNLKDWTGVYDVVDFKNVRFQSSTRVHQTRRIKKIHSGDLFQKYAVSVCGFTGFMWARACSFKSIRTGVDGALLRTWVIAMPYLQLWSKPWDLATRQVYRVTILESYCYRWAIYAKTTWVEARGWWVSIRVL